MRAWIAIGSTLGVTALGVAALAAPGAQPPAAVAQAVATLDCMSLTWSTWSGGWWADCKRSETTRRDGELISHRYVAFHRQPDGQFARDDIAETHASNSPRVKVGKTEKVTRHDARVTYEARTDAGYLHRRVWDLSTTPASLVEDRDGGGKICIDGIAQYRSNIVEAVCSTDFTQRRQSCIVQQPDCAPAPVQVAPVRYTALPVHAAAAPLRELDLFHCATTVGTHAEDVLSGRNVGRTRFEAVAVDDDVNKTLALHLRVHDGTPQPLTGDAWQAHDHWQLWLSKDYDELACDDTADLASFCQRSQASQQIVEIVVAPAADGSWKLFAATPSPPTAWATEVHAHNDDKDLIVELSGGLRDWARGGGLTLVYSDSVDGRKPDSQLATSPLRADRADSLGRLGNALLCDRVDAAAMK